MRDSKRRRDQLGFSLIETLVALLIMSLITMILVSALRIAGQYSVRLGEDSDALIERENMISFARAVESTLQFHSEGIDPAFVPFEGEEGQIKFISTADIGRMKGAFSAFSLHRQPSSRCKEGVDLVLDWSPGFGGPGDAEGDLDRRHLISCARKVDLAFYGRRSGDRLAKWHTEWRTVERAPRFVEFKVQTMLGEELKFAFALKYSAN
jgi:prepilin-type N-terminal cleavage/methylation domain-containing protein